MRKRQRTAALQNLAEVRALNSSRSVLECGSPLPLFRTALCKQFFDEPAVADELDWPAGIGVQHLVRIDAHPGVE